MLLTVLRRTSSSSVLATNRALTAVTLLQHQLTTTASPILLRNGSLSGKGNEEGLGISRLGISQEIVGALAKRGITKLFPIQIAVLEPAMQGNDMFGRARTGTGKTLAFGIPILDKILQFNAQHWLFIYFVNLLTQIDFILIEFDFLVFPGFLLGWFALGLCRRGRDNNVHDSDHRLQDEAAATHRKLTIKVLTDDRSICKFLLPCRQGWKFFMVYQF
ncbi:RNA HELICASE [Salix koriyanagi]|uniref:RNA HELICASE n=1 Tax=Salix koriyanagi TaxID=2511006 RepID=A0A9Q1APZ1_9ROSI|nr:RNA HELICASE [Salix koriyanagi]